MKLLYLEKELDVVDQSQIHVKVTDVWYTGTLSENV